MKASYPVTSFRWSYIAIPLALLVLAVALTVFFYPRLPPEVAYRFKSDGTPDGWLSRGTVTLALLVPQFILTLFAGAITLGISKMLQHRPPDSRISPSRLIVIMGNMMALPQVILCFAMLTIFSYNSYRIYIMPLWLFGLIVALTGTIILAVLFKSAIRLGK